MPRLPNKPCKVMGCREYAASGIAYCENHRHLHLEREGKRKANISLTRDKAAHNLYGTKAWTEGRAAYLAAHPLCLDCLERGVLEGATEVDHVVPHRGDRALFFDQRNWRGLCKPCHSKKTARQDGGFGNRAEGSQPGPRG